MKSKEKTKEQLMDELVKLCQQITELQKSETKHQQIEETLRESKEKYRILVEMATDAILIQTVEGRMLECNTAGAKIYGYTKEEMIGLPIADRVPEEFAKTLPSVITEKETTRGIFLPRISKKKDGTIFPTEIASKIINIAGKPRLIAYIRDITKRKEAEKKLRKARKMFASLFEGSPQAAIYHDKKGVILNINPRFTELFGYTLEEVKGKNINQGMIFPQNKTREESERLTKLALEGKIVEYETIRKKKDGTLIPVIISTSSVIVREKSKGIIAFYQDITKQKNILEKLKENEERYRNLFENMPGAYYRADKDGNLIMINPEGAKLFGYNSSEDILGKNISQDLYFAPEERKKYLKELEKNKGNLKDFELNLKKRDGSPLVISDTSHYYYDKEGNIAGIEGIFIDITERKKSEEALRQNQQELASIFKNIPQAVVYLDENSNIENISPRFAELFGYTLEEIKDRNINEGFIHPPGKIEEGKNLDKIASSEGYFNYESIRKKKDGTLFPVSISGSNIIIDGQLKGIIGTYFDITERKKLEKKLEKLAHFDNLTGCYSRGYGLALLEEQIKTANRKKTPILLFYLDVDEFKEINDTYGHKEGDRVLKKVAQLFKSTLRKVDIICRIGGDEFMLIFPESSLNNAPLIRERLSKNLEKLNQSFNKPYKISFSIGLSHYNPSNPQSIEELIRMADENMYKEKKKKKKEDKQFITYGKIF